MVSSNERRIFQNLEKPLSSDWNLFQSYIDLTTRNFWRFLFAKRASIAAGSDANTAPEGFLADSFKIRPQSPASMNVVLTAGLGIQDNPASETQDIDGVSGVDDDGRSKPIVLSDDLVFAVPAAGGSLRIDLIEVQASYLSTDSSPGEVFNVSTRKFDPATWNKALIWDLLLRSGQGSGAASAPLYYKVGTPGGPAPSVDTGYIALGYVRVPAAATTVPEGQIIDSRKYLNPNGVTSVTLLARTYNDGTPGALNGVVASAGIKAGIVSTGTPIDGSYAGTLYLVAGGAPTVVLPTGITPLVSGTIAADPTSYPRIYSITTTTASAGDKADLVDPAKTSTPLEVAEGQPIVKIAYRMPSGAITGETYMDAALGFQLQW